MRICERGVEQRPRIRRRALVQTPVRRAAVCGIPLTLLRRPVGDSGRAAVWPLASQSSSNTARTIKRWVLIVEVTVFRDDVRGSVDNRSIQLIGSARSHVGIA